MYFQLKAACCSQTARAGKNLPGSEEQDAPVPAGRAPKAVGGLRPAVGARRVRSGERFHFRGWFEGDKRATWLISRYYTLKKSSTQSPCENRLDQSRQRGSAPPLCLSLESNVEIRIMSERVLAVL